MAEAQKKPTAAQLQALLDTFPWADWNEELEEGFAQHARDLVTTIREASGKRHGVEFDQDDPFLDSHMSQYVGDRIKQLSDSTREDVARVLRNALAGADNLTTATLQTKILDSVRETFKDYEAYRALRIARTETATLYNTGEILGSAGAGFTHVMVSDGNDCPPCAEADGKVWTIQEALENPLQHPNCLRAFSGYEKETEKAVTLRQPRPRAYPVRAAQRRYRSSLLGPL